MLAILKLIQSLFATLQSDGTPGQIAAGVVLGSALGLTPIMNLHNLVIFLLLIILNVSFGAGMLAWAVFVPVGFLLDPLFNAVGRLLLLGTPVLRPLWTALDNTALFPYTNFNNTVVLGSVVVWLLLTVPLFLLARYGVIRYRATLGERVRHWRIYQLVTASKAYNVYRWFRPS
ncbi:MAG TPA: TIGR03546 family protein [Gemmatimonadaceae bacterium]|nr:TIGR03546 family protein [Gemmatimonadaceae bacterium]